MITSKKLSIALLISAFGYAGTAHGMQAFAAELMKQAVTECEDSEKILKQQRDESESVVVLNQNFEIVSSSGKLGDRFKWLFGGLEQASSEEDSEDNFRCRLLKKAALQAEASSNKSFKFEFSKAPLMNYRCKVFALKGKNKIHYVVKLSSSMLVEQNADCSASE